MKKYKYTIDGTSYEVEVGNISNNKVEVEVNGKKFEVELEQEQAPQPEQKPRTIVPPVALTKPATEAPAPVPQATTPKATPVAGGAGTPVISPLPGVILTLDVKVGDQVQRGQRLAVLEAMKMENDIKADVAGTVTAVSVNVGDSVPEGTTLLTIG